MLGGSWDLVSKVIITLIGVISIVTLIITLVTKSHDPLSVCVQRCTFRRLGRRPQATREPPISSQGRGKGHPCRFRKV